MTIAAPKWHDSLLTILLIPRLAASPGWPGIGFNRCPARPGKPSLCRTNPASATGKLPGTLGDDDPTGLAGLAGHRLKPMPAMANRLQAGWVVVAQRALARLPWQTPDSSGVAGLAGPGRAAVETDACHGKPAQAGWVVVADSCLGTFAVADAGFIRRGCLAGLAGHRLKPMPAMANRLKPVGSSSPNCSARSPWQTPDSSGVAGLGGPGWASVETDACYGKPAHAGWVAAAERASARFPWQTPD